MPTSGNTASTWLWLFALTLLAGCAHNPHYDPAKPHHTPEGFRDPEIGPHQSQGFWRWQWQRWRDGLPPAPAQYPVVKSVAPALDFLHSKRSTASVTWINHASLLIQIGGLNLLTDPIWSDRASPIGFLGPKRRAAPGIAFEALPKIDAVLISHNHYDHLDAETVERLDARFGPALRFYVPLGLKPWFTRRGIANVVAMDWWDEVRLGETRLVFTPARHWSMRAPWDRNRSLWGGFWLEHADRALYFAGDTGYGEVFREIRQRLGSPDLAALPVGTYEPHWFMGRNHTTPAEAVQIHRDLGARRSLGIHWGTFELSDEPLDAPPRELAAARREAGLTAAEFLLTAHGETVRVE